MYFCRACFCDSSVSVSTCITQCVFLCEFAFLLSHTSHLMAPLNAANREPEGLEKEPALKKKKKKKSKERKKEGKTQTLLSVKPHSHVEFEWHMLLSPLRMVSRRGSSTLSLPGDNGGSAPSRPVQFLQCQLLSQSRVQA